MKIDNYTPGGERAIEIIEAKIKAMEKGNIGRQKSAAIASLEAWKTAVRGACAGCSHLRVAEQPNEPLPAAKINCLRGMDMVELGEGALIPSDVNCRNFEDASTAESKNARDAWASEASMKNIRREGKILGSEIES